MRPTSSLIASAALLLALTGTGCSSSLREYRFAEHQIRIDVTRGPEAAAISVDGCEVEGVYYDRAERQWGAEGHTYRASYWELDTLAQDLAAWGAGRCAAEGAGSSAAVALTDHDVPAAGTNVTTTSLASR